MRAMICLLALTAASPADAKTPIAEVVCAPTAQMTQRLESRMGSTITATGLRNPEEVMEVWTDAQGEWTLVIRYASGNSCIVAMGQHWQSPGTG